MKKLWLPSLEDRAGPTAVPGKNVSRKSWISSTGMSWITAGANQVPVSMLEKPPVYLEEYIYLLLSSEISNFSLCE